MYHKPKKETKLPPASMEDVKQYLDVILTPKEVVMLKKRIEIIRYLELAKTQRWIAEKLKTSTTVIGRIKKSLFS